MQEEVAEQMAMLLHKLKHKVALAYAGVFFITARQGLTLVLSFS